MLGLSLPMLIVLSFAAFISVVCIFNVIANVVGHETQLLILRNHVKDLHFKHSLYLARLQHRIPEDSDSNTHESEDQSSHEKLHILEKAAQNITIDDDSENPSTDLDGEPSIETDHEGISQAQAA